MRKKIFCGGFITVLAGTCVYLLYYNKYLKDFINEKLNAHQDKEIYAKTILMMDKLLEAEDLFNQEKVPESMNVINEIDSELLTDRANEWLVDLEKEIRKTMN